MTRYNPLHSILVSCLFLGSALFADEPRSAPPNFAAFRQAVEDLSKSYGDDYPVAQSALDELRPIESAWAAAPSPELAARFSSLQRKALLANPLLREARVLLVRRKIKNDRDLGMPTNHECNSSLKRDGYNNELAILSLAESQIRTLYRPAHDGYVGEVDLHWDSRRLLFTQSDSTNWKIFEIGIDGDGLRQVSKMPDDVDSGDPCYLPDGRIVFGSTASFQAVPCWHGQKWVTNLYLMNSDGSRIRQLCFDQDHDLHPAVLASGHVVYSRWDYTGINHIFMRQLMVMSPDGRGQRAVYGSNSWFPNALYFPRELPGAQGQLVCILSGYHGPNRMGQLVIIDTRRGWHEADGLVKRISGRGDPIRPIIRDRLVENDWPRFLHPWPINEKYFLVAAKPDPRTPWGIYLADVFDNLVLIRQDSASALLEPILLTKRTVPPVLPDLVDASRTDATVYLHNIYAGPGLAGVPRGTVKKLRVLSYHFGYRHLAGPDRIGIGGPWEVMRILGTTPVESDGSASFKVPANTPIALQPLDGEGKAVALMRSWMTAMPDEVVSCVGCHEKPAESGPGRLATAALLKPRELDPWYGPARGFDFEREVQPVLTHHCAGCHDGRAEARLDLRPLAQRPDYRGRSISNMGIDRLHPEIRQATGGVFKYTPAYEALIPYLRRVGVEDDVSLLMPAEYHADTSPLIQLLNKGHGGAKLDPEAWDRLVTWIDLNAPCHGTWSGFYRIPEKSHERRMTLRQQFGGPLDDPENVVQGIPYRPTTPASRAMPTTSKPADLSVGRFDQTQARKMQQALGVHQQTIDLGDNVNLKLMRIPAGRFVMGDPDGQPDEQPAHAAMIEKPYWMGAFEITNAQFRRFDPAHDSRYYGKRHAIEDDQGLTLNGDDQPAVRISWNQAMAYCQWLSQRTGRKVSLPTEAQWEWACRAGSGAAFSFGGIDADYSPFANLADLSFSRGLVRDGKQITGGLEHLVLEGAALADRRFDDRAVVTAPVGSYRPNAWGLYDMHGNASEWTRSEYQPYRAGQSQDPNALPVQEGAPTLFADQRLGSSLALPASALGERKVVRGGSFFDPPSRCRSAYRLGYPAWQRVFNVGFRVVVESD